MQKWNYLPKIIVFWICAIVCTNHLWAQTPQLLNYQGVARNAVGNALPNKTMALRVTIRNGSALGSILYTETRIVKTNGGGLFVVQIGADGAISTTGSFSLINWQNGLKFLQVEMDPDGNASFLDMGTIQLVSVPYALHAEQANNALNISGVVSIPNGGTGATTTLAAKNNLGLGNVDNTSDANKPISTATQSALNLKANTSDVNTALSVKANASDVNAALSVKANSSDVSTALALKANASDVNAVLSVKANSSDVNTALALKANASDVTSALTGKEDVSNKSTNIQADATSVTKYPTVKAVKEYVDANSGGPAVADATSVVKGKIQLGGDLAGVGSTAAAPLISDQAITTSKLADGAVTDAKIATGISASKVGLGNVDNTSDASKPVSTATQAALNLKANTSDVNTALAVKANTSDVNTALAVKANTSDVNTALALKANTSDVNTALTIKANASDVTSALTGKEDVSNKSTNIQADATSVTKYPTVKAIKDYVDTNAGGPAVADATSVVKGKIQLGGDLAGVGSTAAAPLISNNAVTSSKLADGAVTDAKIATGISASKVGLGNVDNTSDASKPISTATQAALNLKANTSDVTSALSLKANTSDVNTALALKANTSDVNTALTIKANASDVTSALTGKEDVSNKSTNIQADATSVTKYPTVKAIKDYVDANAGGPAVADATSAVKGKIQLGGDLAGVGSTAAAPLISDQAITTSKLADGAVTEAKIATGISASKVGLGNVDNTSDASKPVSTATQAALNLKANTSDVNTALAVKANTSDINTALALKANTSDVTSALTSKEDLTNKSTDILADASSTSKYPSVKSIKDYVDGSISTNATIDATGSVKGKIQLGGDLAGTGSTAAAPVISDNAITAGKIINNAVTNAKIASGSVTYSKIQEVSATDKVLGRISAGAGVVEEISTTGSGNVVRATSPTLVTPNVGAASGTSLSVTGQLTSTVATGTAPLVVSSTTPVANLHIGGNAASATIASNVTGGAAGSILYQTGTSTTAMLAKGSDGQVLTLASGIPAWTNALSVGSISASSTANGASISSNVLSLTPADATNGGILTNGVQSIAGNKTFKGDLNSEGVLTANAAITTDVTANLTITAANAESYKSKIIICNPTAPITITFNTGLPTGFNCMVLQKSSNTNVINFAAGSGVTLKNRNSYTQTAGSYALVTVVHIGNNIIVTAGDMQ